jgi:hypothetical protein
MILVGYTFWMAEREALLNSKDLVEFLTSEVKSGAVVLDKA